MTPTNEGLSARLREGAAQPNYSRGDRVAYTDHQHRPQIGAVLSMEAHWPAYSKRGAVPYLIYTLEHPTYHNKRFYCGPDKITHLLGVSP